MQSRTTSLPQLIDEALAAGTTRARLAAEAGCTRMQLWRLYRGLTPETSPTAQRLRSALTRDDPPPSPESQIDALIKALIAEYPQRAIVMLQMLRSIAEMLRLERSAG